MPGMLEDAPPQKILNEWAKKPLDFVDTIHRHAYRVTDEDVARLRASYDDDQLFELVVCAALGASQRRLAAGLAALELA